MRILHTADWHLGDRMGRIDRTGDLRAAVERIAGLCEAEKVDVLLVAGDLFSELSRPESLRESIEHLQGTFAKFLTDGGTILAITGNHDNEIFCQTLCLVMNLAAPVTAEGDVQPSGRLHLAANPTFLRLADRKGEQVQFLLMPYPTPTRYLQDERGQRYGSLEEKHRALQSAYAARLREFQNHPRFDPEAPTVVSAHIHVQGASLPGLFRMSEQESIIFAESDLPAGLDYVALGHIHMPHALMGLERIRYSGSIERLDLGEKMDNKSIVIVDIGAGGLQGEPVLHALPATPMYDLQIVNPREELPQLRERYREAERALVRYQLRYTPGEDNLHDILRELDRIFPRWYQREWTATGELGPEMPVDLARGPQGFREGVLHYLRGKVDLEVDDEADRVAILGMAEQLLQEEGQA